MKLTILFLIILSSSMSMAANKCGVLFSEKTKPIFMKSADPLQSSINVLRFYGDAVKKGQIVRFDGRQHEILSWGLDKNNQTHVVLQTKSTGEIKEIKLNDQNSRAWKSEVVTLEHVLKFQDENIIKRIMRDHPEFSENQARELFLEMKKWFFVKARAEIEKPDVTPYMYNEIDMIDYSWHAFLLFTVSYRNFGMTYFGKFLEHTPSLLTDPEAQRYKFYDYVKETLGEETYNKWFVQQIYDPYKK